MAFNLEEYETVEERLIKFWEKYPDGRIETDLVESTGNTFIVLARIYRTEADPKPWTNGYAREQITNSGVNATSALENCETSAIGRALANANFAAKGKRPSREEMVAVERHLTAVATPDSPAHTPDPALSQRGGWSGKIGIGAVMAANAAQHDREVKTIAEGVSIVNDQFPTAANHVVPLCDHGEMTKKTGIGKSDRPYFGYVCPSKPQCPAVWYEIDKSTGYWRPRV